MRPAMTAKRSKSTWPATPRRESGLGPPDPFDPFVDYVTARLVEDPHL